MAVTHSTAARNAATNAVTLLLNASGAGKLVFRTTGNVTVPGTAIATLTFSATAFGAPSSGTATANAITSDTNAAGGTVATATLETGAAVVVVHCEVAGSGSDINLTGGLNVTAGDTVSCSSLTYTALTA
jgi:hypothetical protein